uniref:SNTX MACPF/CDC-like domain-containing protein n=1 Tax=Panagrolaimus davidi TaxID=227884 RepID=A0A914QFL4_9BILA
MIFVQKNQMKKDDSKNESTLSLHISSYENSIEDKNEQNDYGEIPKTESKQIKQGLWNIGNNGIYGSTSNNPFEFPRQQSDQVHEPEVSEFKASQTLVNPNSIVRTSCSITRPADGDKIHLLGAFLDANYGNYINGKSLFSCNIHDKANVNPKESYSLNHTFKKSFKEIREILGIDGGFALGFLSGAIKAKGQGKYLASSSSTEREIEFKLVFKMTTVYEQIILNDVSVKCHITSDVLKNLRATHVLTGITYGATLIINVKYELARNETIKDVEGKLMAKLGKNFLVKAEGEVKMNIDENDAKEFEHCEFVLVSDGFIPEGGTVFQSIQEVAAFISTIPYLVKKKNDGKGVPVSYHFAPTCDIPPPDSPKLNVYNEIDEGITSKALEVLHEMNESKNYLSEKESNLKDNEDFIEDNYFQLLSSKKEENQELCAEIKYKLSIMIPQITQCEKPDTAIRDEVKKYSKSDLTFSKIKSFYKKEFKSCELKIQQIQRLKEANEDIIFVGKETSAEDVFMYLKSYHILFFNCDDSVNRLENLKLFMKLSSKNVTKINSVVPVNSAAGVVREENKFVFVDSQLNTEARAFLNIPEGNRICKYVNANCVDPDCLQTWKEDLSTCFVQCTVKPQYPREKPNKRVDFDLCCPGSLHGGRYCCDKKECEWYCFDCQKRMQFGFDGNLYCNCGFAPISSFEYRCSDPLHDSDKFIKHDPQKLNELVSKIRVNNDMNILLLSEPGIDTLAWIQDFVMSLNHPNEGIININRSDIGGLRVYDGRYGKKTLRYIDISDVCDFDSFFHRREDIVKTWQEVSKFDELHGIIVLLKPDNSDFSNRRKKYIMNGLLSTLPSSALKNIVFCVTPANDDSYRPDIILKPYIKEINHDPNINVDFTPETVYYIGDDKNLEKKIKESRRFFNHFENDVKPYNIENDAIMRNMMIRRNNGECYYLDPLQMLAITGNPLAFLVPGLCYSIYHK